VLLTSKAFYPDGQPPANFLPLLPNNDHGPSRSLLHKRSVPSVPSGFCSFSAGNQGLRYFPYSGYLGLTPIRVEGGACFNIATVYPVLTPLFSCAHQSRCRPKDATSQVAYRLSTLLRDADRPCQHATFKSSRRLHPGAMDERGWC